MELCWREFLPLHGQGLSSVGCGMHFLIEARSSKLPDVLKPRKIPLQLLRRTTVTGYLRLSERLAEEFFFRSFRV